MTVTIPHDIQSSDCQRVSQVLARVGEKWSILIVMTLASHPHRFSGNKETYQWNIAAYAYIVFAWFRTRWVG